MTRGYDAPGVTMTPNRLFDEHMALMSESELKVVLCAVRKTLGWHKQIDAISLSQFEKMTGLSRQAVITGIASAISRGVLIECGTGKRGIKQYSLNITGQENGLVNEIDQSTNLTGTGQQNRPVLVNKIDTQKKLDKRNSTKEKASAADAAQASDQILLDGQSAPVLPEPAKKRSPKQLANDERNRQLVEVLGNAYGVMATKPDEKNYATVAKTLIAGGVKPEQFQHYCEFWRNRAKQQGWTITIRALVSNGRISEYVAKRDEAQRQQQQTAELPASIPGANWNLLNKDGGQ